MWPRTLVLANANTCLPGTGSQCGDSVEILNVKYSLVAKLVSGLPGPVRMTCITLDTDQLRPPPGVGDVALEHCRSRR